ncbi:unnamed protein product [Amaranthus hypochondriacus]
MTEVKEVDQSSGDISGSANDDSVALTKEMVSEDHIEEKENMEEKEEREEEEEDEDEEEEQEEEDDEEMEEEVEEVEGVEEESEEEEEDTEESEEDTEDEQENKLEPGTVDVSINGGKVLNVEVSLANNPDRIVDSPIHGVENRKTVHAGDVTPSADDVDIGVPEAAVKNKMGANQKSPIDEEKESITFDTEEGQDVEHFKEQLKNEAHTEEGSMNADGRNTSQYSIFDTDTSGGGDSGTEDEQEAFVIELEKFHKERSLDFKPPKFYGGALNLLKLWRAVVKLGGYDKVTACKYWRQVGESFKPPKTCTTVSWTFRIFYEKALLDYERYRAISDGSSIPDSLAVTGGAENQASGSGRARRESAARAMQGWHSQRILDNGEVSDPVIKDKTSISLNKKEKQLKNLGILKRKKQSSTDLAVKPARTKMPKTQTETTVIDIGSPADWVKINVRETKDCYEVYALVPGLLREEVRVQSDPAGRLVISGEPENPDNPWSVTPFKKVVSLPSRIDPHQTSAVVTLHGQLFVRVPFEQYD